MKLTIVCGPFLPIPPGPGGAVEKMWYGLSHEFASMGHSVTIVSRRWPACEAEPQSNIEMVYVDSGDRTGRLVLDLLKDFVYSLRCIRKIADCDVTVTNVFWLPILLRLFRCSVGKLVVSVERFPKGQMFLYRNADALVAPSEVVAAAVLRECPSLSGKVSVVSNPVDVKALMPSDRTSKLRGRIKILYLGRIHPEKGLHLLIEAFRILVVRFPEAEMELTGPTELSYGGGGSEYVASLLRRMAGFNVNLTSAVSGANEINAKLNDATHFCYPSVAERGESFGVGPLEAMATGLAPIVSDLACFRDFISDGVSGYVFDHRSANAANSLAQVMIGVLEDPVGYGTACVTARKSAELRSERSVAEQFDALFCKGQG